MGPFGGLGASFLIFWEPFLHPGSTLGSHFGTSGASCEAILAPGNHPGKPWEEQDGHELAKDRMLVDLGMISGLIDIVFFLSKML